MEYVLYQIESEVSRRWAEEALLGATTVGGSTSVPSRHGTACAQIVSRCVFLFTLAACQGGLKVQYSVTTHVRSMGLIVR